MNSDVSHSLPISPTEEKLRDILSRRIMVLDGAMGTMIQRYKLTESDYRGGPNGRFADFQGDLCPNGDGCGCGHAHGEPGGRELFVKGNNELLTLTQPPSSRNHESILRQVDIVETNTFGATSVAQDDYRWRIWYTR